LRVGNVGSGGKVVLTVLATKKKFRGKLVCLEMFLSFAVGWNVR
jgi:hypothetical protein